LGYSVCFDRPGDMQPHLGESAKGRDQMENLQQLLGQWNNPQLPDGSPLPRIFVPPKPLMTPRSYTSTDLDPEIPSHQHAPSEDDASKAPTLVPEGDSKLDASIDDLQRSQMEGVLSAPDTSFAHEGVAEDKLQLDHGHSTSVLGGRKTAHDVHIHIDMETTASRMTIEALVKHRHFDHCIGVAILCNALVLLLQADNSVRHPGQSDPLFFDVMEVVFFILFATELVLRLYVFRCSFFTSAEYKWNCFDVVIVLTAAFELVMEWVAAEFASSLNATSLRLLRIIKIARLIRVIRVVRVFRELRIMVMSIVSTLRTLLWSLVCVLLIMSGIGSYLAWVVADYLATDGVSDSEVKKHFGSVPRIMISLFQAISGGVDWSDYSELLCRISFTACGIFYAYISMMIFAIMNILTGICVNNANKAADDDMDLCTEDMLKNEDVANLRKILVTGRKLDRSGSTSSLGSDIGGTLNWVQLKVHLSEPRVRAYFKKIGLEPWHLRSFFQLLKVGDKEPEMDIDQFIRGCMRLRSNVKNIDLMAALHETKERETRRCNELKCSIREVHALVAELQQWQGLRSAASTQAMSAVEQGMPL